MSQTVTVKIFFERRNGQKEIRRFPVNTAGAGVDCVSAIREKVKELYSSLAHGNFQLFWQDSDGDRVAFSSMDELKEALAFVGNDNVLRVYIPEPKDNPQTSGPENVKKPQQPAEDNQRQQQQGQQQTPQQSPQQESQKPSGNQSQSKKTDKPFHEGVTCDGCEGPVYGIRYKCCVCPDYDLCEGCEGKSMHNHHDMYKINQPRGNPFAFLPPHLGRHIHRFMRNSSNTASASSGASSSQSSSFNEDYLNRMGANIASFLDPFGIDVTYDVHTNGDHQTGGFRSGGRHFGGGRGAGCCGKSGGGTGVGAWAFCPAWENMEKRCATENKKENKKAEAASQPTESSQMETDAPKSPAPNVSVSQDVPMAEEKKKESPVSERKSNGSEDWTYVSEQEVRMADPNVPIPMPAAPIPEMTNPAPIPEMRTPAPIPEMRTPAMRLEPSQKVTDSPNSNADGRQNTGNIYPNLRIQQSLDQMLAMGFSNNNNWLSDLLQENDADIGLTLDAIKAKATQQLDSLRGPQ